MKKVRIIFTSAACLIAVGSAFAFANPFFASKAYKVDPISGAPIMPLQEITFNHTCVTSTQKCKIVYQLDAQGNIIQPGQVFSGTLTQIP